LTLPVKWPGYPSFTKQIASKDWKKNKVIQHTRKAGDESCGCQFLLSLGQKHANTPCEPPNSAWRIGPNGIRIEHLVLVSLHRVSQGSWQPKLSLLHDNAQQ
ncbi:hypothetical protein DFH29DRAFT_805273, partial [Suillus ampliporus]